MAELRKVFGKEAVKILCNRFGFQVSGRKGSHVRLSKQTEFGKIGTVVPMHPELKIGTLKAILKQACIFTEEFARFL